jgi:hypothetical protein
MIVSLKKFRERGSGFSYHSATDEWGSGIEDGTIYFSSKDDLRTSREWEPSDKLIQCLSIADELGEYTVAMAEEMDDDIRLNNENTCIPMILSSYKIDGSFSENTYCSQTEYYSLEITKIQYTSDHNHM